ncbi:unnamed protein product [Caenorhabditis bovis]|uniref:PUM-HD domain-containing protein n=1 Tax=Caenorhabditis bovis TaxID=2654633 RepID=A0A8S1F0M3_9PELO|nr:unnamed protein product [Caenorhabditis bovis]
MSGQIEKQHPHQSKIDMPIPESKYATGQYLCNSPANLSYLHNESANASLTGCAPTYSPWNRFSNYYDSPQVTGKPPRTSTPRREQDGVHLRLVDLNLHDDSYASSAAVSNVTTFSNIFNRTGIKSSLPQWALDGQGNVAPHVTLADVLSNDSLIEFASDKNGCRFLQEQYPAESDGGIHDEIFNKMVENSDTFLMMCRNMFGNFFVQRIVECSRAKEQEIVMSHLRKDIYSLCLDKSACRVIQLAIQKLDIDLASQLSLQLRGQDLVRLSIDQNGNHVVQKIIKTLPVAAWEYVIDFFKNDDNLIAVCQDKYGCRVIQSTIEKLSDNPTSPCYKQRAALLQSMMSGISRNCAQLASNEFANYVIQHVIKSGGIMEIYRDSIIEKCLLRNLLSMSQEKYASHVVEVAFLFAPHHLLYEMMEEIFEGYVPHPETNRDALDILLFHQYGNYIIQQMIHICRSAITGQKELRSEHADISLYEGWLERIKERVFKNSARLERFSSGKKIIEALNRTHESKFYEGAARD